jgi:very-short-patch-repair endonuclease
MQTIADQQQEIKRQIASAKRTKLEDRLLGQIIANGLPAPKREHKFHSERKWSADFCWPRYNLLVEVEGGIWTHGAHVRGKHFESDCEKYNQATLDGWRILRFTSGMITSGEAVRTIRQAIETEKYYSIERTPK